jgi:ankyrin repeat protein
LWGRCNAKVAGTNETHLHKALSKAGRPYYFYVVRLLVEKGANVNAKTIPGIETGAFMRDVRTRGETPLHGAGAYAEAQTIEFLIANGADLRSRDVNGDSPLSWASMHLRPGRILSLLAHDTYRIGKSTIAKNTSDHGQGWGNGMEWNLLGQYLPQEEDAQGLDNGYFIRSQAFISMCPIDLHNLQHGSGQNYIGSQEMGGTCCDRPEFVPIRQAGIYPGSD